MRAGNLVYLMSNTYIYDGTFSSLLALVSILLKLKNNPNDIKSKLDYEPNLLDTPVYLDLGDIEEKVLSLKEKISVKVLHTMYYVYLSVDNKKELVIFYFIKNALKYNDEVFFHRNLNCVNKALKISQSVSREAHYMKGFLRFKYMKNNFYYAEMAPTNNVISIIAKHFVRRLTKEYFVIKDVKRKVFAVYNLKDCLFLTEKDIVKFNLELKDDEEEFEELWKSFFKSVAIKERKNLKTQISFMPKKYWNYMIEMEDEL